MKKIIYFSVLTGIFSATAFANDITFSCKLNNGSATIQGSINADEAILSISDSKNELGIWDFKEAEELSFNVIKRKKEEKYSFARYYNDYSALDGLDFSLPKDIIAQYDSGKFVGYFVIYSDNGDVMAPGEAMNFSCRTSN